MKLRTKFNREIAKASIAVMLIFFCLFIPWQAHKAKVFNEKLIILMHTFIAKDNNHLANAIFENRTRSIHLRIEELLKIDGIRNAAVFNSSEKIIASSSPDSALASTDLAFGQAEKKGWASWADRNTLLYLEVIKSFDETMGFILIEYSLEDMKNKETISLLFYTMIFMILILTMLFLTNKLIRKIVLVPVEHLTQSMSHIEKGRYGKQITPISEDEIGELAKRFNIMSSEINASYGQIEEQNQKLQKTKNLLDSIVNSMPSLLITIDNQCRVKQWNTKTANEVGFDESTAEGNEISDIFGFVSPLMPQLKEAIAGKKTRKFSKIIAPEGNKKRYFDLTVYPIISGDSNDAVVIIDDITTLTRMENTMVQTEKMMSVGGLAAGMAHEINNPLSGMLQSANVMKSRLKKINMPANIKTAEEIGVSMDDIKSFMEKRDIFRMIDAINESGMRAAEIVASMLSFARQSDAEFSSHDPARLMDQILELAATDYDLKMHYDFKAIEIIKQYEENLPMLHCEGSKIQQVLLNILRNGAQAMQAAETELPEFIIRIYRNTTTETLSIEIEDNGPGMTEEVRLKVFDPFFTTKPVGIGTGLGLSVSYFIITENHNGTIEVVTEAGKGTNFIIRLPIEKK